MNFYEWLLRRPAVVQGVFFEVPVTVYGTAVGNSDVDFVSKSETACEKICPGLLKIRACFVKMTQCEK